MEHVEDSSFRHSKKLWIRLSVGRLGRVLDKNNSFWNIIFIKLNIFFELICKKAFQVFQTLPTYNLIHYLPYNYILYLIHFIERKLIYSIKIKIISIKKMEGFVFWSVPNPSKYHKPFHFPSDSFFLNISMIKTHLKIYYLTYYNVIKQYYEKSLNQNVKHLKMY